MRTKPPFVRAAIADAAIARCLGASIAIAQQISRFWSFDSDVADKIRTGPAHGTHYALVFLNLTNAASCRFGNLFEH